MGYRYETHCHCSQCSRCARSTSEELVRAYRAAGYAGLVLTDHFVLGNTAVASSLTWEEKILCYRDAWLEAKAIGEAVDFDVIFGIEHACEGKEFLCYGIDPDFLLAFPDIPELSVSAFSRRVRDNGGIVIQAHPFRYAPAGTPLPIEDLDGIEVFNASNDLRANEAARQAALPDQILTSGGDIHRADDPRIGSAGIALPYRVGDSRQFAAALRRRDHLLIR